MLRRLLVLKGMIKGKPVELITKSDAEYVTVRTGNKIRNLTQVLEMFTKEIDSLNAFKRTFGFSKKDYEAMDALKNMIDYMEDKDNTAEIMKQLESLHEEILKLDKSQDNLKQDITNLAKSLTILQEEINKKEEEPDEPEEPGEPNVPGSEDPNNPTDPKNPDKTDENDDTGNSEVTDPLPPTPSEEEKKEPETPSTSSDSEESNSENETTEESSNTAITE